MVELSTFIGQIITDVANARTNADLYAASASELYHADPFVKNLPIPHYIIDSAEVDVPVMVVGIAKSSDEFENQKQKLLEAINEKLPLLLVRGYKYEYAKRQENLRKESESKSSSQEKLRVEVQPDDDSDRRRKAAGFINIEFTETQLEEFASSAETVTKSTSERIKIYLDSYNYDLVKILDLSDEFVKQLRRAMAKDVSTYKKESCPFFNDDAIDAQAQFIGNIMFFEFKRILRSGAAVQIDTDTVQMNEYASRDCLMHIRLKIREQDLSLMVEEDDEGRKRRYLSLS